MRHILLVATILFSFSAYAQNKIVVKSNGATAYKLISDSTAPSGYRTNYASAKTRDSLAAAKQDVLVSGVNIKTINGTPLPGSGNISVSGTAGTTTTVTGSDVVTTSTTPSDVLTIAVSANKKYKVIVSLRTLLAAGGTGGMKFQFTAPSGASLLSGTWLGTGAAATSVQTVRATLGTLTGTAFSRTSSANGDVLCTAFITTGSTAGNLTLQYAAVNAGETNTIQIGSTMEVTEDN